MECGDLSPLWISRRAQDSVSMLFGTLIENESYDKS
jgi:hypothetical protein